jgi:thiosulfate/3-mercaptopyruvate sulfurtransferase
MGSICTRAVLLLVLVVFAFPAWNSGGVSEHMLVSTGWLAAHLTDPSVVILHVGSQEDYAAGHIPGARLLRLADISVTGDGGLTLELPSVSLLQQAFGKVGVSHDSRIVVYPATDSVQAATRAWFTLDYVGLGDRASLLDGGLQAWRASGNPLSTDTPEVEAVEFKALARQGLVVDSEWVQSHMRDTELALLDARAAEFFTGEKAGSMPRAGHIPGARSLPFTGLFDEDRKLLPADSLRELLGARGVGQGKLMVSYCHIGQQASVLYFAARYLGFDARLYDGSFQDWSSRPALPVETGP